MKPFFIIMLFLIILFVPIISESKTLLINTDNPYSSGSCIILKYFTDTISFSNGVSFAFLKGTFSPQTLEYSKYYCGIKVDSSKDLLAEGFRFDSTVTLGKNTDSLLYYNNGDTTWTNSRYFPVSLMHLDTLYDAMQKPVIYQNGKWLFVAGFTNNALGGSQSFASNMINYNNILYFKTLKNKIKIQVSKISINDYSAAPFPWSNQYVDSLRILWAVDSLGNGKFTDFTSTKGINKPAGNTKITPSFNKRNGHNLNFIQNPGAHISLFDIRGKQIPIIFDNDRAIPAGVFVYKIDNNKISALGKVIAR